MFSNYVNNPAMSLHGGAADNPGPYSRSRSTPPLDNPYSVAASYTFPATDPDSVAPTDGRQSTREPSAAGDLPTAPGSSFLPGVSGAQAPIGKPGSSAKPADTPYSSWATTTTSTAASCSGGRGPPYGGDTAGLRAAVKQPTIKQSPAGSTDGRRDAPTANAMEDQQYNPAKLFVGGLGQQSNEASLKSYFSRFGNVTDAVVIADRHSGRSRGFGFVVFDAQHSVESCLNCRHNIDGISCEVRRAVPRDEAKGAVPYDAVEQPGKVYVGGLPEDIKESRVREYFSRFGPIRNVTLMYDKISHRPRGFGFIVFENFRDAQSCWGQHPQLGRTVEAKKAEPRPETRRGGGGAASSTSSGPGRQPSPSVAPQAPSNMGGSWPQRQSTGSPMNQTYEYGRVDTGNAMGIFPPVHWDSVGSRPILDTTKPPSSSYGYVSYGAAADSDSMAKQPPRTDPYGYSDLTADMAPTYNYTHPHPAEAPNHHRLPSCYSYGTAATADDLRPPLTWRSTHSSHDPYSNAGSAAPQVDSGASGTLRYDGGLNGGTSRPSQAGLGPYTMASVNHVSGMYGDPPSLEGGNPTTAPTRRYEPIHAYGHQRAINNTRRANPY